MLPSETQAKDSCENPHKTRTYNVPKDQYLPSATKLRKLCFYTCLSVILFTGGGLYQCMLGYHSPRTRHPQTRPPWGQAPPRAGTPWGPGTPPPTTRRLLLRTVRILLECILVLKSHSYLKKRNTVNYNSVRSSNLNSIGLCTYSSMDYQLVLTSEKWADRIATNTN